MNAGVPPPPGDVDEETAALIEALHTADRRLEMLTAGEVDTVGNRAGQTFLLRRAQEHYRQSEAAKQAAILDALPTHIALLDAQGRIVSVNEAWRRFAVANAMRGPGDGVGVDYLEICDHAQGDDASVARQAAEGIRSVLASAADSFSIEYPCHSPTEQRWFLMTVTPISGGHPNGAVVMHLNITERMRGEDALRRFSAAMDTIADAIYLVDRSSMRFVHVNDAACRMQNRTRDELLALGPGGVLATSRAELERSFDAIIASGVDSEPLEVLRQREDGSRAWVELRSHAQRSGDRWTIITLARNVTARKEAADRIAYLNRVHAMLSGINTLIVRVRDRDELFNEACRIAVDDGGFRMAWVAVVDASLMKLVTVGSAGADDELLAALNDRFSMRESVPLGTTIAARVVREKQTVVTNDLQINPEVAFGAKYAEYGIRSMAVLPLIVADEAVGALVLFASETEFFHKNELKLLTELSGNIAFAIDHIDKQERLHYLAYYDVLTGLANRSLFLERVAQYMRSAASAGHGLAVFLIDLARFRRFNDSLGRVAGDALLKQVADWLARNAGGASLFARVGADQFAAVMPEVTKDGDLRRFIEKSINAIMHHPFRLNDAVFRIAVSVGVSLFPENGTDADTLFRNAEAALKKAKTSGDRYLFFTQKMTSLTAGKLTLENQLRQAIDHGEFVLHYQPKVELMSGKLTGAEALIRWNDPRSGLVPPGRFIPVLEETGLIHEVGRWALHKAIEDYLRWRAMGLVAVRIAVNVSPLQLRDRDFIAEVKQATDIGPNAVAGLELEITESVVMEDVQHSIACLHAIRAMGIRIAIDDFGTGFSSLSYLSRLPVDTLKIDQSFVTDMTAGPQGLALVSTVINLAHSLKLGVVAEGVETEEQARLLRLLGCDEMQGFLVSKPVPCEIFESRYLAPPDRRTMSDEETTRSG